jgi:tetratricopeptide (TPR) repeat protein
MAASSPIAGYPQLNEAQQLFREKKRDAASMVLIEHLRENRNEPRGLALLGEIALESGAFAQAEAFLGRAISLGASAYEVRRAHASAILQQDRLDDALALFTQLMEESGDLEVAATRATVLDRLGRTSEALAAHERVVADPAADSRHWIMYGHALRFAGRTEEAIALFRRVVEEDPERGGAWWGLADIKSKVLTDEDLEAMEKALETAVDILNVEPLHMALGRGWHDRAEYERAFDHYRQGNLLRAELLNYDADELSKEVDQFIGMTSAAQLGTPVAAKGPIPVFLISLPRSGSTLLEQILGRHPSIEATGELPYVRALMRTTLEMRMRRSKITVPELLTQLGPDEAQALGAEYLRRSALHRQTDRRYFIDKMPSNWSDILFIRKILPQARFIEIRRAAMDCCFSNYTHHFGSAHAASFDLVNQARACVDYTRLMDHLQAVAPGLICSVKYEELIEHPQRELGRVLDYLGLEWDDSLLSFYESERSVRTPSAEQVRRPLNRQGIGNWRPYVQWLNPLIDTLGPLASEQPL